MQYTTEELRERKELTNAIIHNLAIINKDENADLEDMAATTANICHDLERINAEDIDLDELEEQTGRICGDLCQIDDNEIDLEELAEQTGEIVANLDTIKQNEKVS
jgi:choline kinase